MKASGETIVYERSPLAATLERIAARHKYLAAGGGCHRRLRRRATRSRPCDRNAALRQREQADEEEADLAVAFLSGRFAALPDDLAADHPDAVILPDALALREWLRQRLETHLTAIIAALSQRTRLGQRAQWNLAADDCASLFLWDGKQIGAQERCCAEGLAFVQGNNSPMRKSRTGYFTLEHNGDCETFRKRGGCCLFYKVGEGQHCSTCPLLSESERNDHLREWMAQQQG